MWYPRGCPVCRGDMYVEVEESGRLICLMCGRTAPVEDLRWRPVPRLPQPQPVPPPALEVPAAA